MSAIGPGDRVRCIHDFPNVNSPKPQAGHVYTVRSANDVACGCGRPGGLHLMEVDTHPGSAGWCVFDFAPTWEGDEEFREAIETKRMEPA